MLSPHTPPTFFPYSGMPGTGYPPMPWGYLPPAVQLHTPGAAQIPSLPSTPTPAVSAASQITVEGWCNKHNLGDDKRQRLTKLGFCVGNNLDTLAKDVWEWAGLGPLHQQHILAAYNIE
ncbi:hypothetical protein L208DRAFT_1379031 [Tricholoma matsutake]|nr:hypothetical protein L208DRAFT_1379031 [Tricholoma matsutake 945]